MVGCSKTITVVVTQKKRGDERMSRMSGCCYVTLTRCPKLNV